MNISVEEFKLLKTGRDVSSLLRVRYSSLIYFVRVLSEKKRYSSFVIKKKSGGDRQIFAPCPELKLIQKRLNVILQDFYKPKNCVHGFIKNRNIVSNSLIHSKRMLVGNIDLLDFFPSIHFGRVLGLFQAYPFNFNKTVATLLAQICCKDFLPQGAPTSPIISNYICLRMDGELLDLAHKYHCFYSRYADDITFSTSRQQFPPEIIDLKKGEYIVGKELGLIIKDNGFGINPAKVRLKQRRERQEVTGLTVNAFPNVRRSFVRQTRAMIHDCYKNGIMDAEKKFRAKYDTKQRKPSASPAIQSVLEGRLHFIKTVRGESDIVYGKLARDFKKTFPDSKLKCRYINKTAPLVITEGASDWMHLKAAMKDFQSRKLFYYLDLNFSEYRGTTGNDMAKKLLQIKAREPQDRVHIFIFDRDDSSIVKEVQESDEKPRDWGNNVYSFALPVPSHRKTTPDVSVEMYYEDAAIRKKDSKDRRLYLSNEFAPDTKKHLVENLQYQDSRPINKLFVIGEKVIARTGSNVALSKLQFAENVLNRMPGFNNFNFDEFEKVFRIVEKIIESNQKKQAE